MTGKVNRDHIKWSVDITIYGTCITPSECLNGQLGFVHVFCLQNVQVMSVALAASQCLNGQESP